jgi:hypothetical protein
MTSSEAGPVRLSRVKGDVPGQGVYGNLGSDWIAGSPFER